MPVHLSARIRKRRARGDDRRLERDWSGRLLRRCAVGSTAVQMGSEIGRIRRERMRRPYPGPRSTEPGSGTITSS